MSKHTPGPWTADGSWPFDGFDYIKILAPSGREIASVIGPQREEQRQADARLIAAAPDLLAALKAVTSMPAIAGQYEPLDRGIGTATENGRVLLAARAAIAKATGSKA